MKENVNSSKLHKSLTVVGWVLCVLLVPILIVNCTLLIKSFLHKDEVPDFGGLLPMIVLSDSMYPEIKAGDLIFCKTVDAQDVEVGDVISFYDPAGSGTAVVTHKVVEILEEDGALSFRTLGINNNTEDRLPVPEEKVLAEYTGVRIPGAGNFAIFMQSTAGLIVCVVLPILLFVGYDVIRRRFYEKDKGEDLEALKAELEALRAANAAKDTRASTGASTGASTDASTDASERTDTDGE
jgi:signal peptidase